MLGSGRQRAARAGSGAGEVIKDDALANVRPADNSRHKISPIAKLRREFLPEDFIPLAT